MKRPSRVPAEVTVRPIDDPAAGAADVLVVPGQTVPLIALDLPPGLRGHAREQVATRKVCDRLGLDPAALFLRPALAENAPWTRVFVADPAEAAVWRDRRCRAVLPDYLTLPAADGIWSIETRADAVCVRLGPRDGFTAAPDMAALMLDASLRAGPKPQAVLAPPDMDGPVARWLEASGLPVLHDAADFAPRDLPTPRAFAHDELACDLRHNPAAMRERIARAWRPWIWPALAAGLAAVLWSAAQLVAIDRAEMRIALVERHMTETLRDGLIPTGPILDIRTQATRALDARQDAARPADAAPDPLDMARDVATVLAGDGARPETLLFREGEGLRLIVRLADFGGVERLSEDLRAAGFAPSLVEQRAAEDATTVRAEFLLQSAEDAR
ncbi:hypothetical protein [Citreimonas sp.]|uniref:hypothetical protein n=1 Tax=Citreimonas sp. TaxID=3036715 RepID=UPI0035C7F551